jgi:hypothetical protein
MKRIFFFFAILYVVIPGSSFSSAADLNDHELYRVVTYTFNPSNNLDETGNSKKNNRFEPLMITRTTADIFSGQPIESDQFQFSSGKKLAQGFAVSADFHATRDLALRGIIGITKNDMSTAYRPNYDSSWEANLGVVYKLFNNLSYEMHFGYMDTGDLFKKSNVYNDVESIVMISNQLTMSF